MTPLRQSEREFESAVIDLARIAGWRVAHFRPALTKKGWRTPVSADGAGWPDLTLCRPPEFLIVELKAERGKLSEAQKQWLRAIDQCGIEWHIWRPSDWPIIEARLTKPRSGTVHWTGTRLVGELA